MVSLVSAITLAIAFVFFPAPVLLVMCVEVALYTGMLVWAWRSTRRGDTNTAVTSVAIGIMVIALSLGLMVPAAAAVSVLLAVLSVMLGLPYLSMPRLRLLIIGVVAVSGAIASVQLTGGLTSIDALPAWTARSILGVGVPATCGLIFLLVLQYGGHLYGTIAETRAANRSLSDATLNLQLSRHRIVNSQEELKREVAEELHGPVQNRISVASRWLRMAMEKDTEISPQSESLIDDAANLLDEIADGELRAVLRRLHPSVIRASLEASLHSLGDQFRQLDLQVIVVPDNGSADLWRAALPVPLRIAIYRVAEEAMNNVVKHAGATKADLILRRVEPDLISLSVIDDGVGFEVADRTPGFGILTMEDYCGAEGGTLKITSETGKGTQVEAVFPLTTAAIPTPINGARFGLATDDDDSACAESCAVKPLAAG